MKITNISGTNFKGRTFNHDVAPVTVFTGPNGRGKSARLEAAMLALAGWVPGIERTGARLFERLASAASFGVEVGYDNGSFTKETWTQRAGSVKNSSEGQQLEMPDECLDVTEFLTLSGPERVRFLFGKSALPPEFTVEALANTICANIKNIKADGTHTEAHEAAVTEAVGAVRINRGSMTPRAWLEATVVTFSEFKKAAAANVQRLQKTDQGLSQIGQQQQPAPQDAEQRLHKARKVLEDAQEEASRLQAELDAAKAALGDAEELAGKFVDEAETRAELERLDKLAAGGPDAKVEPPGDQPRMPQAPNARPTADSERAALDEAKRKLALLESAVAVEEAAVKAANVAWQKARSAKVCPHCGQSIEHLQKEVVERCLKVSDKVKAALAKAKAERDAFSTYTEDKNLAEAQKRIADYDAAVAKLTEDYRKQMAVWSERNARYTEAQHNLKVAAARVVELKDKLAGNAAAREAKGKLPELQHAVNVAEGSHAVAAAKVVRCRSDVSTADVLYRRLLAERAEAASKAKAAAEADKARASAEVLTQACKMLNELQAKLVEQAVGPFLDKCNALVAGCPVFKGSPLTYRDGEIGLLKPTGFYSWKSFSGTEEAIAFAGIQAALCADAPVRVVFVDELDIDNNNMPKLLGLLCDLQLSGKIDNALVAHTSAPNIDRENYTEVKL